MDEREFFVLQIWGDVEPELIGPFNTEEERDAKAKELRAADPEQHNGLFRLAAGGPVEIGTYAGGELEEDGEEVTNGSRT